jgi:nickel transport protein
MRSGFALVVTFALALSGQVRAHELIQNVTRGSAVVIELSYSNGSPFSHEQYEIHFEGEDVPFQTGRTDALGRIVFVPDRRGSWRVRAFSEDGHGMDTTVESGSEGAPGSARAVREGRTVRIVFGILTIVLAFMILFVIVKRRSM